jgi:hypothetical protein
MTACSKYWHRVAPASSSAFDEEILRRRSRETGSLAGMHEALVDEACG